MIIEGVIARVEHGPPGHRESRTCSSWSSRVANEVSDEAISEIVRRGTDLLIDQI